MTLDTPSRLKLGRVVDPIKIHILSEIENQEFLQNFMTLDVAKNCKMKKKYAGIMRLYPKIHLSARLGSPVSPQLPHSESYSVSHMKKLVIHQLSIIRKDVSKFWEFSHPPPLEALLVCLFVFSTYWCDMPRSGFMGYFP